MKLKYHIPKLNFGVHAHGGIHWHNPVLMAASTILMILLRFAVDHSEIKNEVSYKARDKMVVPSPVWLLLCIFTSLPHFSAIPFQIPKCPNELIILTTKSFCLTVYPSVVIRIIHLGDIQKIH